MTRTHHHPSRAGRRVRLAVLAPALLASALLSLALARPAAASCGLDVCPLDPPASSDSAGAGPAADSAAVHVPTWVRLSSFTATDGTQGAYLETLLRGEYRGFAGWVLGASLPIVHLMIDEGDSHTGLGNGVLFGEWNRSPRRGLGFAAGAQLELPIGDSGAGIAADHVEALPYLRLSVHSGALAVSVTGGARFGVGADDDEDGDGDEPPNLGGVSILHDAGSGPLYVNPHESQELLYQLLAEYALLGQRVRPGLLVRGQQVLGGDVDTRSFLTGGAQVGARLSESIDLAMQVELPLLEPARIDWRTALGLTVRL